MGEQNIDTYDGENYKVMRFWLIIILIFVVVVLISITCWNAYSGYKVAIHNAEQQSFSYARALKEHAERTFSEAEYALDSFIRVVDSYGGIDKLEKKKLLELAKINVANIPKISSIVIIDSNGNMVVSSKGNSENMPNVADRDYFRFHSDNKSLDVYFSAPIKGRIMNEWIFTMTKRINSPCGKFDGIAMIVFRLKYFEDLYESIVSNKNGRATLATFDGDYLVLVPKDEAVFIKRKKTAQFFRDLVKNNSTSMYHNKKSNISGEYRIASYNRLDNYPVVAICSFEKNKVIEDWKKMTAINAFVVGILCLLSAALTEVILLQFRKIEEKNFSLREKHKELKSLALYDNLTGLPNRMLLYERLNAALASARRHFTKIGLMFIDMDNFKDINDVHGHEKGDMILKQFSMLINTIVRESDTFARLGGDEFVLVLTSAKSIEDVNIVAEKIHALLRKGIEIDGDMFYLYVSIGTVISQGNEDDSETLIRNADSDMYRNKRIKKGCFLAECNDDI